MSLCHRDTFSLGVGVPLSSRYSDEAAAAAAAAASGGGPDSDWFDLIFWEGCSVELNCRKFEICVEVETAF